MRNYKREMIEHAKKMGIKVPHRRGDAYLGDYILASNERDKMREALLIVHNHSMVTCDNCRDTIKEALGL